MTRVLTVLVMALSVVALQAQPVGPEEEAAAKVVQLARQLVADPNNGELHQRLAEGYMQRGAAGDALRSLRHARRAGGLNPHVPAPQVPPVVGIRTTPLTAEMDEADMQADATLPPDDGQNRQEMDRKLRADLAQRLGRCNIGSPSSEYRPNLKDMQVLFSPGNDAGGPAVWPQRASELKAAVQSGRGGASMVAQAFENFLREDIARRTEAEARKGDGDPNHIPDYFLYKERALVAYRAGNMDGVVADLQTTVAAIQTILTRHLEPPNETPPRRMNDAKIAEPTQDVPLPAPQRQNNAPEEAPPSVAPPTPTAQLTVTPSRQQPVETPPRQQPPDSPPTPGPEPMDASQPQTLVNRAQTVAQRIGNEAMEASEAVRSTRVTVADVGERLETLAAEGMRDPLVLDLNGNGRPDLEGELIGEGAPVLARTVLFDLLSEGSPQRVEWMKPRADGLLGLDRNGDGLIDSGAELVGHHPDYPSASAELRLYDINRDGVLSGAEVVAFRVWRDDGDGRCTAPEVYHLDELAITEFRANGSRAVTFRRAGLPYRAWDWYPRTR